MSQVVEKRVCFTVRDVAAATGSTKSTVRQKVWFEQSNTLNWDGPSELDPKRWTPLIAETPPCPPLNPAIDPHDSCLWTNGTRGKETTMTQVREY